MHFIDMAIVYLSDILKLFNFPWILVNLQEMFLRKLTHHLAGSIILRALQSCLQMCMLNPKVVFKTNSKRVPIRLRTKTHLKFTQKFFSKNLTGITPSAIKLAKRSQYFTRNVGTSST